MFKLLGEILKKYLELLTLKIKEASESNVENQWYIETGRMFNDLISRYAISEEELLYISKDVCEYVTRTRITNVHKLLFKDSGYEKPRNPHRLD